MSNLPAGTVTFFFTDIEGSTALLGHLGDRYADVLAHYRRLLRETLHAHGGQEVDTQGDAFLAVFARAKDGLWAAVSAQRQILTHQWPGGVAVRCRIGLHTGEPLKTEVGYVGIDVHRAARICSAGHGGQILLSQTTLDLTEEDLAAAKWPLGRPPFLLETTLPGVFAVGDARAGNLKRVAPAVGEGSIAVAFVHQVLRA